MALARLCASFFLLVYLEVACGQQQGLSNIAAGLCLNNNIAGSAQQILQRRAALLSELKNCNQNANANMGAIALQQLQNNQPAGLQQENSQANNHPVSCQCQQKSNLQQAINAQLPLNLQQSMANQNEQISVNQNVQRPVTQNIQQLMGIQSPQKLVVQQQCVPNQIQQISANPACQQSQNLQQNINLQPQVIQQQQTSNLLNNIPQGVGQTALPQSDMSIAPVNKQLGGLPTQVSQGTLLSHLGIQSNLPAFLPNIYGSKQTLNQAPLVQNNFPNNVQTDMSMAMVNGPQTSVLSSPMASQQAQKDSFSINPTISTVQTHRNPAIQQQVQLIKNPQPNIILPQNQRNQNIPMQQVYQNQPAVIPAQYQSIIGPSQNEPNPSSFQGQSVITSVQSQPIQSQPMGCLVQKPQIITSDPCQPTTQAQNQQIFSSIPVQNNPMVPSSHVPVSQSQSLNGQPQYPNNLPGLQNNGAGSKSSGMKQLLPLLFNLLKEKSCCGCRPNQNCGCMNNNNPMFTNQQPQVFQGYAQHVRNVPAVVNNAANMIDSEEDDDNDTVWRLQKYRNYNKSKTQNEDSSETVEDDDSTEDVKDDKELLAQRNSEQ